MASSGSPLGSLAFSLMDTDASFSSPAMKNISFTSMFSRAFLEMYALARGSSISLALLVETRGTNQMRYAVLFMSSAVYSVNAFTYQGNVCGKKITTISMTL